VLLLPEGASVMLLPEGASVTVAIVGATVAGAGATRGSLRWY